MHRVGRTDGGRRGRRWAVLGVVAAVVAAGLAAGGGATGAQPPDDLPPFVDVPAVALEQAQVAAEPEPGAEARSEQASGPLRSRSLRLNRGAMESLLAGAPDGRDGGPPLVIALPAPDGSMEHFEVWENDLLSPETAAAHPEIRTYSGQGVDEPAATIALDLSPLGFHAQVLSPAGNWYIDPAVRLDDVFHASFYRDDIGPLTTAWVEEHEDEVAALAESRPAGGEDAAKTGSKLRTHRLAVAATRHYTDEIGGGPATVLAQITATINRVTGIYEKELAISFTLITQRNGNSIVYEAETGACFAPTAFTIASLSGGGASNITVTTTTNHNLVEDDVVFINGSASGIVDGGWGVASVSPTDPKKFVLFESDGGSVVPPLPNGGGTVREWSPIGNDCDPFTGDQITDFYLNQAVIDQVIGEANYDVGHIFTTTGGGIARLRGAGVDDQKALGLTGLPFDFQLTSDEFAVDFVSHELGHQYGGSHTFNGTRGNCVGGNWGGPANAFEPGSGSTIQAYAGICGTDNLQNGGDGTQSGDGTNASDPYFHSRSYEQIQAHVAATPSLAPGTNTGNTPPTVDAGPSIVIPAQTPFFLGATGSDANGDPLTYHFEQRDPGGHEPLDAPDLALDVGPLYRSFPPTSNPTSFFPRLSDLADGSTNQNGVACPTLTGSNRNAADCWAQLLIRTSGANSIPLGAERELDFVATVRDNRAGGGGVDSDDTIVIVHNTGDRFRVTAPNGGQTIAGNTTVTWNVGGTTGVPISAPTVSIRLSTDGGVTYPTILALNVPNDGSQPVTMPNAFQPDARVMVHSGTFGGGSGFFDISDADFTTTVFGPQPPSAPIGPDATPGDASATVSWMPPSSDGGAPITRYDVTSTPGNRTCSTTGALSCTVTGLTNGVSYTFAVTATNVHGTGPAATTPAVTPIDPRFVTVPQQRLTDTRGGAKIGNGTNTGVPLRVNVRNKAGLPGGGIDAVSLNLTIDQGQQPTIGGGYATIYAHPTCAPGSQPNASNLNFHDGKPIANAVVTPVDPSGNICIFVYGTAHVLLDVNGWFPDGSDFTTVPQRRVTDTRSGAKVGNGTTTGVPLRVNVHNKAGLPGGGIDAVSLNLTIDQGQQPTIGGGYATIYAHPTCAPGSQPNASNLNFHDGKPIANAVVTPVDPSGNICIFVYGTAHVLVDVNGWFPDGSDFTTVPQRRLTDTRGGPRVGNGTNTGAPLRINVHNKAGLPGGGIDAVSLNLTVDLGVQPTIGGGYATVYAHPTCAPGSQPNASNLNFHDPRPIANAVITPVDPSGNICVFVYGRADLLIDVNGYFPD